jgi:hypothetical protein
MARLRYAPEASAVPSDPDIQVLVADIQTAVGQLNINQIAAVGDNIGHDIEELEWTLRERQPHALLQDFFPAPLWAKIQQLRRPILPHNVEPPSRVRARREARAFCEADGHVTFPTLVDEFEARNIGSKHFTQVLRQFQRAGASYTDILRCSRPFAVETTQAGKGNPRGGGYRNKGKWQRIDLVKGLKAWEAERKKTEAERVSLFLFFLMLSWHV